MSNTTSNPTRRVVHVLRRLSANPEGLTLTEISSDLGIAQATCSSILTELVSARVVERSPDKRYSFGSAALSLLDAVADQATPVDVAARVLPSLSSRTNMPTVLTRVAPEGIELLEVWWPDGRSRSVGRIMLPFAAPYGLSAVAWMSRSRVASWLQAGQADDAATADLRRLLRTVRRDRVLGWTVRDARLTDAFATPERLDDWLTVLARRSSEPELPAALLRHARVAGIPGPDFKSSRRIDVEAIVAPVFGCRGVPHHQVELFCGMSGATRARRMHLADLVRDAAREVTLRSGGTPG